MIGKSFKGKGFYGIYRYVLEEGDPNPQKAAHIIGGNMAGRSAKELSSEVRPSRQLRPDIHKPMWHISLSFRPGETVNDAVMQQASDRFLDEMGLERDRHQHLYVRHHDKDHQHVHLVVNRVADDGSVFHLHHDYRRVKQTTRKLEKELGLQPTREHRQEYLQDRISETAKEHPQLHDFCQQLAQQGIRPEFTIRRGKLSGLSYRYQGNRVRGSRLGKAYSFQGLQRHQGIDYQPERDDPIVKGTYLNQWRQRPETPAPSPREPEPPPQQQRQRQQRRQQRRHPQRQRQLSREPELEL